MPSQSTENWKVGCRNGAPPKREGRGEGPGERRDLGGVLPQDGGRQDGALVQVPRNGFSPSPSYRTRAGSYLGSPSPLGKASFPSRSEYREGGKSCLALGCSQANRPTPQNENRFLLLPQPPFKLSSKSFTSFFPVSKLSLLPPAPTKLAGAKGRCFLSPGLNPTDVSASGPGQPPRDRSPCPPIPLPEPSLRVQ